MNKLFINISALIVVIYLTLGGVDYASGPYMVEIPAGQTSVKFNISIIEDTILESNEYFILAITSTSLPNKISPGGFDRTNITIVEDDG